MTAPRLALSNLAFPHESRLALLPRLAAAGLAGVEVAPTRIAPWAELDAGRLAAHRAELAALGLAIPSLQALLFGAEGVALLGDAEAFARLVAHLRAVARVGAALGATVAVFGSPRQRSRGGLPADAAFSLGAERLRAAADAVWEEGGLALALEPVPAAYGGDFLPGWRDCLAMVRAVDHPGLRLHLDTGCVALGGDGIAEAVSESAGALAHFHAAEPKLAPFADPLPSHAEAARALREAGYGGWIAIEMLEAERPEAATEQAIGFVRRTYCGEG